MTRHFSPAAKSPCSDAAVSVSPVSGAAATPLAQRSITPSRPTGGTGAPSASNPFAGDPPNFIELGYGTGPRCIDCRRNVSGCHCDAPEPEAEYFKPGLNREPHDGSVWLRAEEAAVRSSFGMPGVGA